MLQTSRETIDRTRRLILDTRERLRLMDERNERG